MSTTTTNLGLFKYDTTVDGQLAFNINQALNDNWDILDKSTLNGDIITLGGSGTQSLTNNRVHKITCNGNTTFSLPTGSGTEFKEIVVLLYMPTAYSINLGTTAYFNGSTPDMSSIGYYTIIYEYDPTRSTWTVGVLAKDVDSSLIEYPWSQPILSANGTFGNSSFAASASTERSGNEAYHALDGSTTSTNSWMSDYVAGDTWIAFYNPIPIKVTNLTFLNYNASDPNYRYCTTSGKVQMSNDGSNWANIKSYTNTTTGNSGATWSIDLSDNTNFAKYYRIYSDTNASSYGWIITELTITATYQG